MLDGFQCMGVSLIEKEEEFYNLCSEFEGEFKIIVQKFIKESFGVDMRVLVVGDKALAVVKRKNEHDFRSHHKFGGKNYPEDLTQEIKSLSVNVAKSLNLKIAGIDIIETSEGLKIIEANSSPGFKFFEESYPEINVAKKIIENIYL